MNRFPGLLLAVALGLLGHFAPSQARGEIVGADSIEWIVTNSDVVVRGTVVEVVRGQGFFVDEVWDKVTIQVAETLKGENRKRSAS